MKKIILTLFTMLLVIVGSAQEIRLLTEPLENRKPDIVVYGKVTGSNRPSLISLQINDKTYSVALNDTGLFMQPYSLKEGNNVVKAALTESALPSSGISQTLTYLADKNPAVSIQGEITGSIVSIKAIGNSPSGTTLTYKWEAGKSNPEIISFSASAGENSTFILPSKPGEYYFYCTATDLEGRSGKAGRFLKISGGNPVLNTKDMHAAWVDSIIMYEYALFRFESGKSPLLQMADKFQHIKQLGATAVWHTPPFQSDGGGYHVKDYYHIGNNLGTNEDYKEFVHQAHEAGLKVIFDIPVGHTNKKHPFLNNVFALKNNSPYKDYYYWSGVPGNSTVQTDPENGIECVFTNLNNAETYAYFMKVLEYWLKEYDIDGFRYDVGQHIYKRAPGFLIEAQQRLRSIKPDIALFIEGNFAENPNYLTVADICYDWNLFAWGNTGLRGIFNQQTTVDQLHADFMQNFPPNKLPMRYMNTGYFDPAHTVWDMEREKTGTMIAFTGYGTSLMYAGTETGSSTRNGEPVNWNENLSVYPFYRKLAIIKKSYLGSYPSLTRLTNNKAGSVYSYLSKNNQNRIIVVANFSNTTQAASVNLNIPEINNLSKFKLQDLISGETRVLNSTELSATLVSLNSWQSKLFWIGEDTINISKKVNKIKIKATDNKTAISSDQGTLQLFAQAIPDEALIQKVTWSIDNKNAASISENGLLKASGLENKPVKIYASSTDGSNLKDSISISLENQPGFQNLLQNPQFKSNLSFWELFTNSPANATINVTDGVAAIEIVTKGTASWEIQFLQKGLSLTNGVKYNISFDAKAKVNQSGDVAIGKSTSPYTSYFSKTFSLTNNWLTYSYSFTMSSASDNDARLIFDLGLKNGIFYFDNFLLRKVNVYRVTTSVNNAAAGSVTASASYDAGQTVNLTATPKAGYKFLNWTEDGTVVSVNPVYSFIISGNKTVTANFEILIVPVIDMKPIENKIGVLKHQRLRSGTPGFSTFTYPFKIISATEYEAQKPSDSLPFDAGFVAPNGTIHVCVPTSEAQKAIFPDISKAALYYLCQSYMYYFFQTREMPLIFKVGFAAYESGLNPADSIVKKAVNAFGNTFSSFDVLNNPANFNANNGFAIAGAFGEFMNIFKNWGYPDITTINTGGFDVGSWWWNVNSLAGLLGDFNRYVYARFLEPDKNLRIQKVLETDHFRFYTRPLDASLNFPYFSDVLESAYVEYTTNFKVTATEKFSYFTLPTCVDGELEGVSCNGLPPERITGGTAWSSGIHSTCASSADQVPLFYGMNRHEFAHSIQGIMPQGKVTAWLNEGFPSFCADGPVTEAKLAEIRDQGKNALNAGTTYFGHRPTYEDTRVYPSPDYGYYTMGYFLNDYIFRRGSYQLLKEVQLNDLAAYQSLGYATAQAFLDDFYFDFDVRVQGKPMVTLDTLMAGSGAGASSITVKWTPLNASVLLNVSVSIDGGNSWNEIASRTTLTSCTWNAGSYTGKFSLKFTAPDNMNLSETYGPFSMGNLHIEKGIKVTFKRPADWGTSGVNLWAWTSSGNIFAAWPGTPMTDGGNGWFSYTFDEAVKNVNVIFSKNGTPQTVDIMGVSQTTCFEASGLANGKITVSSVSCTTGNISLELPAGGEQKITVYPQPASGRFMVKLSDGSDRREYAMSIIDLSGRIIRQSVFTSPAMPVECDGLPRGLYILRLISNDTGKQYSTKLSVE